MAFILRFAAVLHYGQKAWPPPQPFAGLRVPCKPSVNLIHVEKLGSRLDRSIALGIRVRDQRLEVRGWRLDRLDSLDWPDRDRLHRWDR